MHGAIGCARSGNRKGQDPEVSGFYAVWATERNLAPRPQTAVTLLIAAATRSRYAVAIDPFQRACPFTIPHPSS